MASSGKTWVSPRDLAHAVDVSESSLKRWADGGMLRVSRTAGGHRRIPLPEAIRFVRDAKLHLVRPERLGFPGIGPTSPDAPRPTGEDLEDLFRKHRSREAVSLLLTAYLGGSSVVDLCDGPIRGALELVGHLYEQSDDGIAVEHAAVDACIQTLNTIRNTLPEPESDAPVAVGGSVAGDPYILPSLAVATLFEEVGFRVINAGPNAPLQSLRPTIERESARAVWRSYSIEPSRKTLVEEIAHVTELASSPECDVVLGGRCLAGQLRTVPGVHAFSSLAELSGFARGVLASASATWLHAGEAS